MAYDLVVDGVTIVPCSVPVNRLQALFMASVAEFPDLQLKPGAACVAGGFAALGNPFAFHNVHTRELRKIYIATVRPVLRNTFWDGRLIENLICRTVYREAGVAPSAESWHRYADIHSYSHANHLAFGLH